MHGPMSAWKAIALAGLALGAGVTAGCGGRSAAGRSDYRGNAEVVVEVESHNWSDIVIYLMLGNTAQRLGMVTGLSSNHFAFPYRHLGTSGNTRLRAYPIGGSGGFTSENLLVQPGQGIKWTLESDLSRSSLAVY